MLQKGHRRSSFALSPHNPQILNLEPIAEQTSRFRHSVIARHERQSTMKSAHAECLINLSASNASPFFHTANVIAARLTRHRDTG